jgi:hypothetical protein
VLFQFADNIEALKRYSVINDLHMSAYQPLQTAALAYEVGLGSVKKSKLEKY